MSQKAKIEIKKMVNGIESRSPVYYFPEGGSVKGLLRYNGSILVLWNEFSFRAPR